MGVLVLSEPNKEALHSLVAFASRPENYFMIGADWVPGDRPDYVRIVDSYRVVFTVSVGLEGNLFRHMTLSARMGKLPNPTVVFTLATWCGFEGGIEENGVTVKPGADWLMGVHEKELCVVIAQPIAVPP